MQLTRILFILTALFVAVFSIESRVFLERSNPVPIPSGWTQFGSVSQSNRIQTITFAVKQRNLDQLESLFWAVSDPQNAKYGQHLSLDQITELVGPEQTTVETIVNWLNENGFVDIKVTQAREFVTASAPLNVISRVFNVQFNYYKHINGMITEATIGPYTVPENIGQYLDFITGLVGFPDIHKERSVTESTQASDLDITPEVIRNRYNISSSTLCGNPRNSYAVAEFQSQFYSPSDLSEFWSKFVPFAPEQKVAKVVGTNNPSRPGVEASLDIEYLLGVAPGCTAYFYSQASFNFYSDLVTWVQELANDTNPPFVHSVSYGSQGNYPSDSYIERMNAEFQKLGVRGLSILFASGDSGAGCKPERFANPLFEDDETCDCEFYPSFPATCQYITSVGATRFISGNSGSEAAVYLFKSGGGFSQDLSIPDYQKSAIQTYLRTENNLPESCAFNASGRGTPDVAALGDEHFQVVNNGRTISVGGTSASCPTFAAIVSLLNDIRLNKGQSTLGFLNPFLYQTATSSPLAFYDITIGDNTNTICCNSGALNGFECNSGWDPVTGLGTPNFEILKNLV